MWCYRSLAEEVLLATSARHPALLHINFYSEYRVDVKATVEGQPVRYRYEPTAHRHAFVRCAGFSTVSSTVALSANPG